MGWDEMLNYEQIGRWFNRWSKLGLITHKSDWGNKKRVLSLPNDWFSLSKSSSIKSTSASAGNSNAFNFLLELTPVRPSEGPV